MVKYGIVLVILFAIIVSLNAKCVIQGVCGRKKEHVCRNDVINFLKATKEVNKFCNKFATGSNVCCNNEQVKMLEKALRDAKRWFGGKCYNLMREMFCHMHCSPDQDTFISDVKTDHEKVTSFTVTTRESHVNNLWNACKDKRYLWFRLVDKVCIKKPCNAKEFVRSLGTQRCDGGKSPYKMNFQFI